jgi:glutaredoxin
MKQQCHVSFVYLSWIIYAAGIVFYMLRGAYIQAGVWIVMIPLFLWVYVRWFPKFSRSMGYGEIEDTPAREVKKTDVQVTLYTGAGCPFCPIIKRKLVELQKRMGFELQVVDITLKPDMLFKKGIRSLPVVEVGDKVLIGNATSEQLAELIGHNTGKS